MLLNRTVIISGGTGGIGQKIAGYLLEFWGATVVILGTSRESVLTTCGDLRSKHEGGTIYGKPCDIRSAKSVSALLYWLSNREIRPNALINCAAVLGPQGPFANQDFSEWADAVATNLTGNARLLHAVLPILARSSGVRPKVINFAGGGAVGPRKYHSAYACSKAAMVNLTEQLAAEYPDVDINILAPGVHDTRMVAEEKHEKPAKFADDNQFLGTVGWLLGEESDRISGNFIHYLDDIEPLCDGHRYVSRRVETAHGQLVGIR